MPTTIDLSLFEGTAHSPSLASLRRSAAGGDARIRDFCIPVNPYFPTPALAARLRDRLDDALRYYPSTNAALARELSAALGLDPAGVVLGNGSTELISFINLLWVADSLAIPVPTFSRWTEEPAGCGKRVHLFPLRPEPGFALPVGEFVQFVRRTGARVAVVCNPNNPTGTGLSRAEVLELADELADLELLVVDESFIDFACEGPPPSVADEAGRRPNLVVLKSLGKNFGLHGVRLGYAVAHPDRAAQLRRALPHWNVNGVGEVLITELADHLADYEASRRRVVRDTAAFAGRLARIDGLTTFPTRANFVYVRLAAGLDGVELRNRLLTRHGCLVRECGNKVGSGPEYLRLACRPPAEAAVLEDALRETLAELGG